MLAIRRIGGVYSHFAIYIGDGKVIHYSAEKGDFGGTASIHEADFGEFLRQQNSFEILYFPAEEGEARRMNISINPIGGKGIVMPQPSGGLLPGSALMWGLKGISKFLKEVLSDENYHLYTGQETVDRARSRLGETKYNLAFNNCEHFAIWCKTGIHESGQVEDFLNAMTGLPKLRTKIIVY